MDKVCSGPSKLFLEDNSVSPTQIFKPIGRSSALPCLSETLSRRHVECVCEQTRTHAQGTVSGCGRNVSPSLVIF